MRNAMTKEPSAAVTTRRPDPGRILAVAAGTFLILVAFTTPLTTLASTAAGLGAGPGAQAWVLSAMSVGSAAGLLSSGAIGDDHGRRRTFLAGTLLLGLGLAALMAGLVEGRAGWNQLPVIALLALGLALVVAFVAVERRIAHPMLDLALLRRPDFVGATVVALAAGAGVLALMSLVPTLLERGLGDGALLAAAVLLARERAAKAEPEPSAASSCGAAAVAATPSRPHIDL
jgi:MFS family permease